MTRSYSLQDNRSTRRDFFYMFILFWLFLTFLNFVTRYYYWIFIAFAIFLVTPKRQARVNLSTVFLLMFAVTVLLFDESSFNSVTNLLKPFVFVVAYTMGFGLAVTHDDQQFAQKGIKTVIYLAAFGLFAHYVLNLIANFGSLERNTIDIWTNSVLSATSQASLASMSVGLVAALLFSDTAKTQKILALVLVAIVILYNLILAGRTLLFLMAILFVLAFFYRCIYYKKNILKGFSIVLVVVVIGAFLYNLDLFQIKSTFETSNFYWRFFERQDASLIRDSRLEYKMSYLRRMFEYPFGGGHIHEISGFYSHDLYLDTYDQYSIFAFGAIVAYIISSIIRLFRCLRSPLLPFHIKQLVFCVYAAVNIQFWLEPIMVGMPWLLIAYCLIDGAVAHLLTIKPRAEVEDVR